ncbi:MAG: T9SS type A sorting domain-containing protein [Bacteroidia bacterium]
MRKLLLSCFFAGLAFTSANAQLQHRHVTPIDSVQYVSSVDLALGKDAPAYFKIGDTVTIEGIVTFDPGYYGLSSNRKGAWLQDPNGGDFDGMAVLIDAARLKTLTGITTTLQQLNDDVKFYENFVPGLKVKVTGIVDEYQGYTQLVLLPIESEITNLTPNKIAPEVVNVSTFSLSDGTGGQITQYVTGEPYENTYVELKDLTVVDVSSSGNGRFFWSVQDNAGNKMQIRDASGYFRNDGNTDSLKNNNFVPPTNQSKLNYLRGMVFQATASGINQYYIAPLVPSDIDYVLAPSVNSVSRNPVIANSTAPVTITANITDEDNTVTGAKLFYSVGVNNTNYTSVNMTSVGNNYYQAQIPAQANNSIVNYFISATNNVGLTAYSPDSFFTGHHYMVKNEGITKISDLQYDPFGKGASIWAKDTFATLNLRAVVTSSVGDKDLGILTIQDGTAPFSGIMIKGKTDVESANISRGDSVVITSASVREDFGVTILENVKIQVVSSKGTIPAALKGMSIDSIRLGKYNHAEAYESMLLEFNDVYVVETNADRPTNGNFGEWAIDDDTTDLLGLRVDDLSNDINPEFGPDSLKMNQELEFIRGILTYSFGNWKLLPRDKNDIAGFETEEDTTNIGIKEAAAANFRMYPNPANNAIYIQAEKYFGNAIVQITDLQGKVFSEQVIYGNQPRVQLSTEGLTNGLYLVKISDKTSVQVQKVLIQH